LSDQKPTVFIVTYLKGEWWGNNHKYPSQEEEEGIRVGEGMRWVRCWS